MSAARLLALALATAALAGGCPARAPAKPFVVPATAAWAPGAGGARGAWVDCFRAEDDEHAFTCAIYREDGAIEARGAFTLRDPGAGKKSARPREPMRYASWDGRIIHLEGGRLLVP